VLGDSAAKKTIRFDSMKLFIVCSPLLEPICITIASLTMVMLILFVVYNFFVHINRMLNAGFCTKKISNVVYQK